MIAVILFTAWMMMIYPYQDIKAAVTKMKKAYGQKKKKQEETKRGFVICMDDTVDDCMEVNIRISPSQSTTHGTMNVKKTRTCEGQKKRK